MLSKTQAKYIQTLYHKKFREQWGQYIIEGPKLLSEALHYKLTDIRKIYAISEWLEKNPKITSHHHIEVIEVNSDEMQKITALTTASSVLAIMQMPVKSTVSAFPGITLLLDAIQDPGNLGTIVRTADWFGIKNIICGEGCVDGYHPKMIQSTMGSIFRVNLIYQELISFIDQHKDIPVIASSLDGQMLDKAKREKQAFLIIGNESKGISKELMGRATLKLRIPGGNNVESLNAAIAAGILIHWLMVDS